MQKRIAACDCQPPICNRQSAICNCMHAFHLKEIFMKKFIQTTEQPSLYNHLEKMSVAKIISFINKEDKKVAQAVKKALPQAEKLINALCRKMIAGGRLFYIGAGTSGRLGVLDASECPPTYGVPETFVQGIIAGGMHALTKSIEDAEDDTKQGWKDLKTAGVSAKDFVIGIAASGTTPYVVAAMAQCKKKKISTGCITSNKNTPLAGIADYAVEIITGPEFVTGSTRMKSGTAQKMMLNIISTTAMIKMGLVQDNRMVNMQMKNKKLKERGACILMEKTGITDRNEIKSLLKKYGSVKKALEAIQKT